VGIFHHPRKPESLLLAEEMAEMLRQTGCKPWISSSWDSDAIAAQVGEMDLIITLGGDGSILRAARVGARHDVPILGVKMGRVSFLGEVSPGDWQQPLNRVLAGEYWVEEHMMLRAICWRGGIAISQAHEALNEVVVSRGRLARLVRVAARVDGSPLATYSADGVIVSTATGSTGYALAVGGPVLPPELRNFLVIPIAPHLSLDRSVVLPQGATVELQIFTDHEAILTVDGQFQVELQSGDVVKIAASPHQARFVRLQNRAYFYGTLMERLLWQT
jgi:NAD+ kinase